MVKGIIFDFDGTLSSERGYIYGCFEAIEELIEKKYGIQDAAAKLIALFEESWNDTFGRLLKQENKSYHQEDIQELVRAYRSASPRVSLYEDTLPTIQLLKSKGIKIGALTNGYHDVQREKIRKSGLEDYLDGVEIPDLHGREFWKPDTRRYAALIEDLHIIPSEVLYVGDSNTDYLMAKEAGSKMAYIVREDKVNEFDYMGDVDYVIHSLRELERIIAG